MLNVFRRSAPVVSEVALQHPPLLLSLPLPLSLLVMRCGWAETRPHVSAGSAASSAPIIASLPWHRAQRLLTARHLTAASHAWTPDTVTGRTKSAVPCRNIQHAEVRSVFTNMIGKLHGCEVAPSLSLCCSCATNSRRMWVTFSQKENCMAWTAARMY